MRMGKTKRHIPYKSGIATEVVLGDLSFILVARTAVDLADAFTAIPGIKDPYRDDLSQHVKITMIRTQPEPKMKDIPKPKPRAHNHIPASHRIKPQASTRITQGELEQAKRQAAKFLNVES